jgi:hypothetical protein
MNCRVRRIQRSHSAWLVFCIAMLVAASFATADLVLYDDFDDGVLDPAWQVSFQDAYGWTYAESGTELTATEIEPTVINDAGGGTWAVINLDRACSAIGDFHVDFHISWDSEGSNNAMQYLFLSLLDTDGNGVVRAGFGDAWRNARGCRYAVIGANFQCNYNDLPLMGSASLEIDRIGDQVTILWDGSPLLSDTLSKPFVGVRLSFEFYAYQDPIVSLFGTESVDLVNLDGTLVPVETSSWGAIKGIYR